MPFYNNLPLIGKYLYSNSRINEFSPDADKKNLPDVLKEIGFTTKVSINTDTFDKVSNSKTLDIDAFKGAKGPDGKPLHDKISQNSDAANNIKKVIVDALSPKKEFTEAQKQYAKDMAVLNELALKVPGTLKAQDLIATFNELNKTARIEIVKQHTIEKEALINNLNANNMKDFKTTLGLGDNDNVSAEQSRQALVNELETAQKKQLEEFDKTNKETLNNLHHSASLDVEKKIFIAKLRQNNPAMQAELERIAEEKRKNSKEPPKNTLIKTSEKGFSLSNVTLDDIKTIKSLTGSTIEKQPDGSWSFSVSRHIFSARYHLDPRQSFKTDCTTLANAIKATGSKGIEFDVSSFSDPQIAQEKARQAWESAREAGFKEKDITIKINGSPIKAEDLFKEHASRFKSTKKRGAEHDELREKIRNENVNPPLNKGNFQAAKQVFEDAKKAKENNDTPNVQPTI